MENLRLVKRENKDKTIIDVGGIKIGKDFLMIAGPCSVESEKQVLETALLVKASGANVLRGGAYKPRTSPYSFQGLGEIGLKYLKQAGDAVDLPIITEVVDVRDLELIDKYTDILQIGARNMQNFPLLVEVGKLKTPVLLKRGMNSTIEEWLNSAEYIMKEGNPNVILCERGIRTIETLTRNTLDLSAVSLVKKLSHLPVIVDPSHATGRADLVAPMAYAAIMSACDGLIIEVHTSPQEALSDSEQQLTPVQFDVLMRSIKKILDLRKDVEYNL